VVDEGIIDALNILTATRLCMQEAINSLLKKIGGRGVSPTPYPDPERSEGEGSLRSFGSLSLRMTPRSCQKTAQGVKKICILVDGDIKLRISGYPVFNIIKGDRKSVTIASASILAKVSRDRIMSLYDKVWPQYGFLRHKGYPTSFHRDALRQFGPCPIHRLSFQMKPELTERSERKFVAEFDPSLRICLK